MMAYKRKNMREVQPPPKDDSIWPTIEDDKGDDPPPTDSNDLSNLLPGADGEHIPEYLTGGNKQLYCRTGYNLAVAVDGRVYGTREEYSKYAILRLSSDEVGEVRIRAVEAGLFVAMNDEGFLYGQASSGGDETVFYEKLRAGWNSYLSKKHSSKEWFLAIKKSGNPKRGDLTAPGQKATLFMPRNAHPPSNDHSDSQ